MQFIGSYHPNIDRNFRNAAQTQVNAALPAPAKGVPTILKILLV